MGGCNFSQSSRVRRKGKSPGGGGGGGWLLNAIAHSANVIQIDFRERGVHLYTIVSPKVYLQFSPCRLTYSTPFYVKHS